MANSSLEPTDLEIGVTVGLGLTVFSPYYQSFVSSIGLTGHEHVLDFGSGSGVYTRHIARRLMQRGGRLDCVDNSHRWMETIQNTLRRCDNVQFFLGKINELGLEEQSYDLIISHFSLYKVPQDDLPEILFTFSRLLNTRGRVIFREPLGKMVGAKDLQKMAKSSGLRVTSFNESKALIGKVVDGVIKLNFCGL